MDMLDVRKARCRRLEMEAAEEFLPAPLIRIPDRTGPDSGTESTQIVEPHVSVQFYFGIRCAEPNLMPQPVGHHLRMRLEADQVIARSDRERRQLASMVLRRCNPFDLLAFNAVDTHLHIELAEPVRHSIELCRRLAIGWRLRRPDKPRLLTLPPRPIEDQWHLQNTFNYILDQEPHHGCEVDLYHEASVLPDLIGLRINGAAALRSVRQLLPRIKRSQLLARFGPVELGRPFTSLDPLADSASAAVGLPDLIGRDADRLAAKLAAVKVASPHLDAREIADLIGLERRRVVQLQVKARQGPVDRALIRAIELQLRLRCGVAEWLDREKPEVAAWKGTPLS